MAEHWSEYWKGNENNSFSVSPEDESIEALNEKWIEFIKDIEPPSRIIDIGTGGGALIRLAVEHQTVAHTYIGIDYAKLNLNSLTSGYDNIQILENTNIETLPIDSNSVDIAMSQYAIEYSNLKVSLQQVTRVLKPNGRFMFICHCDNSMVLKKNIKIKEVISDVLSPNGVIELVNDFFKLLDEQPTSATALKEIQEKLKNKLSALHDIFPNEINDISIPAFIEKIFSQRVPTIRTQIIKVYTDEISSYYQRLLSLQNAALTREDIINFENISKSLNIALEPIELLKKNNDILGIIIRGVLSDI
jgi:ubiquinone/menaquinone biosynthesis C-methylase UbiE